MIKNKKEVVIPFKLINNLVIIPVHLNGQELNFILDTGVSRAILFNVEMEKQYDLKQVEKIKIKGLGQGQYFDAIKSKNNLLRIHEIASTNLNLYLLVNAKMDFSASIGMNIHGLIGADFFDDFVVKINYTKKKIYVFKKDFTYKIKNKFKELPLSFINKKPYVFIRDNKFHNKPFKMLIDSGSSDALWFYNESTLHKNQKFFNDLLGKGLSGNIHGKKAKLTSLKLNNYVFKNIITCYPDSLSFKFMNKKIQRDGSIGGEILKRFTVIFDYSNKKMFIKKNGNFKKPFLYNMSGIYIKHNGQLLVRKTKSDLKFNDNESNSGPLIKFTYDFSFENSYIITHVKKGSISEKAGLKENDLLLSINNINAYNYSLDKINYKISNQIGKTITLLILRNNVEYKFTYTLKDIL